MAHINRIKPYQGGEQAPVRLGEPVTAKKASRAQMRIEPVERFKQWSDGLFVRSLGRSEARLVDSIVERIVDAAVEPVDLRTKLLGVVITGHGATLVKGRVEHADDLCRLIVHNSTRSPIPENRHRHAATV